MIRNKLPHSAEQALLSMYQGHMGDTIKQYERLVDTHFIKYNQPFIVRIDGVSFSKFTQGITKPFDQRLTQAMVKTAIDLTERFNATLAYHQSDEISLFFLEQKHSKIPATHIYSGRVQKIVSVIASYAAARFNHHLTLFDWLDLCPKVAQRMLGFTAHFDGRVVPCDSNNRAMECIFWRSNFDGLRNAISHISHHHSTRDQLHGISVIKQLELLEKRQVDVYKTFSDQILYGTWIKREQFELENAVNPKTGLPVKDKVLRSRFRSGSFNWAGYTVEQREQFLTAKFWNNVQDPPPMHDL